MLEIWRWFKKLVAASSQDYLIVEMVAGEIEARSFSTRSFADLFREQEVITTCGSTYVLAERRGNGALCIFLKNNGVYHEMSEVVVRAVK